MGFFLIIGSGPLGLLILFLGWRYTRSSLAGLACGVIAAVLMGLQCIVMYEAAGIGSATSGSQKGYNVFTWAILIFTASIVIYFFSVLGRFIDGK